MQMTQAQYNQMRNPMGRQPVNLPQHLQVQQVQATQQQMTEHQQQQAQQQAQQQQHVSNLFHYCAGESVL